MGVVWLLDARLELAKSGDGIHVWRNSQDFRLGAGLWIGGGNSPAAGSLDGHCCACQQAHCQQYRYGINIHILFHDGYLLKIFLTVIMMSW